MVTVKEAMVDFEKKRFPFAPPDLTDLPSDFKLPSDLPVELFQKGLSCYGQARLILAAIGGKDQGKIVEVTDEGECHAFVVRKDAKPEDLVLNNSHGRAYTVKEVSKRGLDVTEEILGTTWEYIA